MKTLKKGFGRMIYMDSTLKEYVLVVENLKSNEKVIIPKSEIYENKNIESLIGKLIDYVELNNGVASMNKAMPIKRALLLNEFERGEVLSGKITSIKKWGAFLSIKGVSCLLRNTDFAEDATTIADLYKVGDNIDGLILRKVSSRERISLEKLEKFSSPCSSDLSEIKKGNIVLGTIRHVKSFGCFVAIACKNLDALCPIPEIMDIEEGMKVKCRLTKVDLSSDNKKIRGKIVQIIG